MTFLARLGLFLSIAVAGIVAWHWSVASDSPHDLTHLAVQQFDNSDAVPANLQRASLAQNWWPFIWPAGILILGVVFFWDDAERWWNQTNDNFPG